MKLGTSKNGGNDRASRGFLDRDVCGRTPHAALFTFQEVDFFSVLVLRSESN